MLLTKGRLRTLRIIFSETPDPISLIFSICPFLIVLHQNHARVRFDGSTGRRRVGLVFLILVEFALKECLLDFNHSWSDL